MAVPGFKGHLRNTSGGEYTKQTYSAVALGLTDPEVIFTRAFGINDAIQSNQLASRDTLPRERSGAGTYNAKKILSGGEFAYNAAKYGTYIASRLTNKLAGISNNALLFMGKGKLRKINHDFAHDFGARILSAFRANLFAPLGLLDNGQKLKSRRLWLDPANPVSLTTTNMLDIADGNATDKAFDRASKPTRAIPGTLVVLIDFTDADIATSGNYLQYSPITYA
jgi:hypothetical protein